MRPSEPECLGREGVTRLHGRSVFHRSEQHTSFTGDVDPGEVDHDLLDEQLQVRLGSQPVLARNIPLIIP